MSALIKCSNPMHIDDLKEELKDAGYISERSDTKYLAVFNKEVMKGRKTLTAVEVEKDLSDLIRGFVLLAFASPNGAYEQFLKEKH